MTNSGPFSNVANSGCTSGSNNVASHNAYSRTEGSMINWARYNTLLSEDVLQNADQIIAQQNDVLRDQNEQLNNKRLRNEIQQNAIDAKRNIINTRARMLQIAQENNVYKQKIIYTLIAFIFAVFIAILVMYVFYSKKK